MKKNKNIEKKYKDLSEEQKQKRRDYQKQYIENITDEQKLKIKDYRKEYYKRYYIEKKNIINALYLKQKIKLHFSVDNIKMSLRKIKFRNKEVNKK